jgi:DNA polymerase-3 subunit delta
LKYYQDFVDALSRDRVAPVYLFYGDEVFLHRKALERLKDKLLAPGTADFDMTILDGEEVALPDIVRAAQTTPVLNPVRLVIVRPAPFLASAGKKRNTEEDRRETDTEPKGQAPLVRYLEAPLSSTCLVFCNPGPVDRRRKAYKLIADHGVAIDFELLKRPDTAKWLQREVRRAGKQFTPAALDRLQDWALPGLDGLSRELEKVLLHAGDSHVVQLSDVEAVVVPTREETIFQVVDAIGVKNGSGALEGIRSLLAAKEPPLKILAMLARQFRLTLCVQELAASGLRETEIASALQTRPFVVRKIREQSGMFTRAQALYALEGCLEIDSDIKSGRREFLPAVSDLLLRVCLSK